MEVDILERERGKKAKVQAEERLMHGTANENHKLEEQERQR